jgi:hypothetical protein
MGVASTRFRVDSSNVHASQVTRTLVSVRHGSNIALDSRDDISNCDINRYIPGGVYMAVITTEYQCTWTVLGCLQSNKTTATSPIQTRGLLLKKGCS